MSTPHIGSLFPCFCNPVGKCRTPSYINFNLFPFSKRFISPLLFVYIAFCIFTLHSYQPFKKSMVLLNSTKPFPIQMTGFMFCAQQNIINTFLCLLAWGKNAEVLPKLQQNSHPSLEFDPLSSQHHNILYNNMPSVDGWQNSPHHHHFPTAVVV